MRDDERSKEELIAELEKLRRRVAIIESGRPNHSESSDSQSAFGTPLDGLVDDREILQTLIDNLPDFFYVKDRESRFVLANRSLMDSLGITKPADLVGKTDLDLFPQDEAAAYRREEVEIIDTGRGLMNEVRFSSHYPDGPRWASVSKIPLRHPQTGEIVGLVGLNRDITELKKTQQALADSEHQYRSTLDAMSDAIHVVTPDMKIILANRTAREWAVRAGIDPDIVGVSLQTAVPFLPETVLKEYEQLFADGVPQIAEDEFTFAEWDMVTETRRIPITENGRVARAVTVVCDITDRKRVETALRESETRIQQMVDSLPVVLYSAEAGTNRALLIRGAMRKMFGHDPDEFLRDPEFGRQVEHPEDRDHISRAYSAGLASRKPFELEYRIIHGVTGEVSWLRQCVVPVIDANGQLVRQDSVLVDITAAKKAEHALKESESRFRTLAENSLAGVYIIQDGVFVYVNPAMIQMGGYTASEVLGRNPLEFAHPDDRELVAQQFGRRLTGETETAHYVCRAIAKTGATIELEVLGRQILHGGRPALMGTMLDVTEQRRAQRALQESESLFRMLTESSLAGVYIIQDGAFVYVNPAFTQITGYDRDEVLRMHPLDLSHPDDRESVAEHVRRRLTGKVETVGYTTRVISKQGAIIHLNVLGRRVTYNGRLAIMGTMLDTTEERKAEQALRESESKYRTLFEEARDAILLADTETGVLVDCNHAATELTGRPKTELIGQSHLILHRPHEARGRFTEVFRRHMTTDQGQVLESQIVTASGQIRDVAIKANFVEIGGRRLLQGLFRDITDRKQAEDRLRLLLLAIEQSTEGVAVADLSGNLILVNNAFARMHGLETHQVIGRNLSIFHLPSQMPAVRAANRRVRREGHFSGEVWHTRKDGTVFLGMMNNTLLRSESGKATGMLGVLRDITALKAAELRSARLAQAVSHAGEGIAIWDDDWCLSYANPSMTLIFGCESADQLAPCIWPDSLLCGSARSKASIARALRQRQIWRGRLTGIRPDGKTIPLAVTLSRLDTDGNHFLIVGNVADMTHEEAFLDQIRRLGMGTTKLLEEERLRISRELHDELGQLLTVANMELAGCRNKLKDAEPGIRERFAELHSLHDRMLSSLRGLTKSLRPALLDYQNLTDAIRSLVDESRKNREITYRLAASPPDLDVPNPTKTAIYRIAQESLTNVLRHSGATRCVVSLRQKRRQLMLQIRDNGRQADPAALEGFSSLGIIGMKERAASVGGTVHVRRTKEGSVCVTALFSRKSASEVNNS